MVDLVRQKSRTASLAQSIWHDISEVEFREHVVALEHCTNAVPVGPAEFELKSTPPHADSRDINPARSLPLSLEQGLADDIASVVAVEEGAQSVAAVCLEEHIDAQGLTVRIAAVDAINEKVQNLLHNLFSYLESTCQDDMIDFASAAQYLFELILPQHHPRILGRLRSSKWEKPLYLSRSHKKPLWQDFANIIHRVQFLFVKKERKLREELESALQSLAATYKAFEEVHVNSVEEVAVLHRLIKSSYDFCTSDAARIYARRLHDLTHVTEQVKSAIKSLQQVEKIAAYWRLPNTLVKWSRQHPSVFQSVKLAYIMPYTPVMTETGYESWAKTCHVHAEVQLAVFYDLQHQELDETLSTSIPRSHAPRCIGTSKYLCYLCFLFLTHRNAAIQTASPASLASNNLRVANTHGRLYDQWTIPDLADFGSRTVHLYRTIINAMDQAIYSLAAQVMTDLEQEQIRLGEGRGNGKHRDANGKLVQWRVEPMTSRENLLLGKEL